MKINLLLGGPSVDNYLNIDELATDEELNTKKKVKCLLDNLDEHVDNAECDEILALDVLEYFTVDKVDAILRHWITKLRRKGKIVIGLTNLRQVFRSVLSYKIDSNQANILIYGIQQRELDFKKTFIDLDKLYSVLQSNGLEIINKRIDGFQIFVTARRV